MSDLDVIFETVKSFNLLTKEQKKAYKQLEKLFSKEQESYNVDDITSKADKMLDKIHHVSLLDNNEITFAKYNKNYVGYFIHSGLCNPWLTKAFVVKKFRRKGIYKKFFKYYKEIEEYVNQIGLGAKASNIEGIRAHKYVGFEETNFNYCRYYYEQYTSDNIKIINEPLGMNIKYETTDMTYDWYNRFKDCKLWIKNINHLVQDWEKESDTKKGVKELKNKLINKCTHNYTAGNLNTFIYSKNVLVGFCTWNMYAKSCMEIEQIFIEPMYRNKGIFKCLLDTFPQIFKCVLKENLYFLEIYPNENFPGFCLILDHLFKEKIIYFSKKI